MAGYDTFVTWLFSIAVLLELKIPKPAASRPFPSIARFRIAQPLQFSTRTRMRDGFDPVAIKPPPETPSTVTPDLSRSVAPDVPKRHEIWRVPPLERELNAAFSAPESSLPSQRAPNARISVVCAGAAEIPPKTRMPMASIRPRPRRPGNKAVERME